MARTFEVALQIAGRMRSSFRQAISGATGSLDQLNSKIAQLNKTQQQAARMRELSTRVLETSRAAREAQARVAQLGRALGQTQNPTRAMRAEFERAQADARRLNSRLAEQKAELAGLKTALNQAGVSMRNLSAEQARMAAQSARLQASRQRVQALQGATDANRARRSQITGDLVGAVGLAATVALPVKQAIAFESSMADVRKVTDLSGDALREMSNEILRMSGRLPIAAAGIAEIVAAAGQAGIEKDQLLTFAETAAKMATAFDVSAGEAGEAMAKWRTGMRLNQTQAVDLADAVNELSNRMASTAPEITAVLQRVGGLATTAGLGPRQVAALGSSMIAAGASAEVAATGTKNLVLALSLGQAASKAQKLAFSELGMDAVETAELMQRDAAGTIVDVMKRLRELPEEARTSVAESLFGRESLGAISPMLANLEALQSAFSLVGDSTNYAGSMQKEAANRAATTANNLQLLTNNATRLAITLGNALLPTLNQLVSGISPILTAVGSWMERNPRLTQTVVTAVAALLALNVATKALLLPVNLIHGAYLNLAMIVARARAAIVLLQTSTIAASMAAKVAAAAQWLLNAAVTAFPIIAMVAAVAFAAVQIYKYWDDITGTMSALWNASVMGIKNTLTELQMFFSEKFNAIKNIAGKFLSGIMDGPVGKVINAVSPLAGAAINTARATIPALADGGIVRRPTLALIGEAGPEAVVPLRDRARGLGAAGGGGLAVTFAPVINLSGDAATARDQVERGLRAGADDLLARLRAAMADERRLAYG